MSLRRAFIFVSATATVASLGACSSGSGNDHASGSTSGNGAGSAAGYASGTGSSAGATTTFFGQDGSVPTFRTLDGSAPLGVDSACGATVLAPEAITVDKTVEQKLDCTADVPEPIAIYLVLDNSGSMKDDQKWTNAVAAINRFVQTDPAQGAGWKCVDPDGKSVPAPSTLKPPGAGAISVALQYFHPKNVGSSPNECDGSGHSTPAVPMGPLPANGTAIAASLAAAGPTGKTPTVGALLGGTEYCTAYEAANPGKKCAVVLVTDGQPNGCGLSSQCPSGNGECVDPGSAGVLTPIAAKAFGNAADSVVTFTVGMSGVTTDGFALLDAIAKAGGADCTPTVAGHESCDVTTSGADGLLAALDTIRKSVQVTSTSNQTVTTTSKVTSTLACEWAIPKPTSGQTFDKSLVNITYSIAGQSTPLGNVPTQADCASTTGAWYYDDAAAPTRILACPDTCSVLQNSTDVSVRVLIGCSTVAATIR